MESIAKEFAQADNWGRASPKMRHWDKFGSMYGFHVRGSSHYPTKVGAVFSIMYIVLVMATFTYYLLK